VAKIHPAAPEKFIVDSVFWPSPVLCPWSLYAVARGLSVRRLLRGAICANARFTRANDRFPRCETNNCLSVPMRVSREGHQPPSYLETRAATFYKQSVRYGPLKQLFGTNAQDLVDPPSGY
jgi:hypothetical protein